MSNKIYGKEHKEKALEENADPVAPIAMALQAHALAQTLLAYYASNRAWQPAAGPVPFEAPWTPWAASYFAPSPYYGTTGYPGAGPVTGFTPGQACAGTAGCCGTFAPRAGAGTAPSWVSPWQTPAASPWSTPPPSPWTTPFAPPWAAHPASAWTTDFAPPWATLAVPPWVSPPFALEALPRRTFTPVDRPFGIPEDVF